MLYLVINKTSSVLTENNIRSQKKFTPLNSIQKVQFRSQNKTFPRVKFLRITKKKSRLNRQQSKNPRSKKVSQKVSLFMLLFS